MDCSTKSEQRQITAIVMVGDAEERKTTYLILLAVVKHLCLYNTLMTQASSSRKHLMDTYCFQCYLPGQITT